MPIQEIADVVAASAWLVVSIEDGNFVLRTRLPLRWTLIVIGALGVAIGSPAIVELVTTLLNAR